MPDQPPQTPSQLGPYRVLELIGSGLQGTVYRAEHIDTAQPVALKLLAARPSERWRARREIHTLAALEHANLVPVLARGESARGPWYAMPLLTGPDLVTRCRGRDHAPGPLMPERLSGALAALVQVAEALAYLHGRGIIHRDLKPSNVLLDGSGRPILLDLGLAHHHGGSLSRERIGDGSRSGTLAFMAPEQLRGEQADARADLFAFGCLLYAILAGRLPFGEVAEVLDPGRVASSPSSAGGVWPTGLDDLVLRLLAKEPRERLAGADLAAAALAQLAGTPAPPSSASPPLFRPAFVGRTRLAEAVARRIAASLAAHSGGFIAILGAAGLGKTRLATQTLRLLSAAGHHVLAAECRPGAPPLAPLVGVLESLPSAWPQAFADPMNDDLAQALARLAPYVPGLASFSTRPDGAAALLPPDHARRLVYRAVQSVLAAVTHQAPLVVGLDDLQWADELTLGWLATALHAGDLSARRFVLLATVRDDEIPPRLEGLLRHASTRRLALTPLAASEVGAIVSDMLGAPAAEPFVADVVRAADGNPLFVAEYVRSAVERGALRRETEGLTVAWRASSETAPTRPPRSLEALIAERVARLPANARRVAEAAAILRPTAPVPHVYALASLPDAVLHAAVRLLLSAAVLAEDEDGRLRFEHPRVGEVVYAGMGVGRRMALHRRAAEGFAALGDDPPEGAPTSAEVLAYHFNRGGRPERARPLYLEAARQAVRGYSLARARSFYEAYLGLARGPSPERAAARCELARDVLLVQGDTELAASSLAQALREAETLAATEVQADVLLASGRLSYLSGRLDEAASAWRTALAVEGDERLAPRAALLLQLARVHHQRREDGAARDLTSEALSLHQRLDDPSGQADAFVNLALIERRASQSEASINLLQLALQGYRRAGNRLQVGHTRLLLGNAHFAQDHTADAAEQYEAALTLGRELGDRHLSAAALGNLGNIRRTEGRYEDARRHFEASLAENRAMKAQPNAAIALAQLGSVHLRLGDLRAAVECAEGSLALRVAADDRVGQARALTSVVEACVAWGRLERAERHLAETRSRLDRARLPMRDYLALVEGRVALAFGRLEAARAPLEEAIEVAVRSGGRGVIARRAHLLFAELHLRQGALEPARREIEAAFEHNESLRDPYWRGWCDLLRACWGRHSSALQVAHEHAARALRTFERTGARLGAAAAHCELGHIALFEGAPAREHLASARLRAEPSELGPDAPVSASLARLEAALRADAAGEPLTAGEAFTHLDERLQTWHGGRTTPEEG